MRSLLKNYPFHYLLFSYKFSEPLLPKNHSLHCPLLINGHKMPLVNPLKLSDIQIHRFFVGMILPFLPIFLFSILRECESAFFRRYSKKNDLFLADCLNHLHQSETKAAVLPILTSHFYQLSGSTEESLNPLIGQQLFAGTLNPAIPKRIFLVKPLMVILGWPESRGWSNLCDDWFCVMT